jgi:hypothetical protein
MVQMFDDAGQIAHAVSVGVGEGSGIDLIEDSRPPPGLAHACRHEIMERSARA